MNNRKDIIKYNNEAMKIHEDLCNDIHSICAKKNKDYGSSAHDSYVDYGLISYVIRINDKLNRVKSLVLSQEQEVKDEKIEDTLLDMANYCLLAVTDIIMDKEQRMDVKNESDN